MDIHLLQINLITGEIVHPKDIWTTVTDRDIYRSFTKPYFYMEARAILNTEAQCWIIEARSPSNQQFQHFRVEPIPTGLWKEALAHQIAQKFLQ